MKAVLKSNRKIIIDVLPLETSTDKWQYRDRNDNSDYKLWSKDEIEFIEYQGG